MSLRSAAVRSMRRLGLVPGGQADLLGEDDTVVGERFDQRIMVFFPDPPENIYQLEQWLAPLERLDEEHGVLIVLQDSRTAKALRSLTRLQVRVIARNKTLDTVVRNSRLGLALYVGQANANAVALRQNRLAHVFLSHGESDKLITVSNLEKSFDQVFVGGTAAIDRHRRALMFFDANRLVVIGRPQALELPGESGDPFTMLYAPTWEGTQAVNAHSSILTHAAAIVAAATPESRVIFRPHPRTGRSDAAYKAELAAIVQAATGRADSVEVDTSSSPSDAMARADVLVTDVSAMAVDWLATQRPLIITAIDRPGAAVVDSLLLASMPRLASADASSAAALAASLVGDAAHSEALAQARKHYLGDLVGERSLEAFVDACTHTLTRRDAAWAAISAEETSP